MTHDVDALVKPVAWQWRRRDSDGGMTGWQDGKHGMSEGMIAEWGYEERALVPATALQAEHEARVKAESERGGARRESNHWLSETRRVLAAGQDAMDRATAAEAQLASAREALEGLENACERMASVRSQKAYRAIIADAEAPEALLGLDAARRRAREALRSLPAPAAGRGVERLLLSEVPAETVVAMRAWLNANYPQAGLDDDDLAAMFLDGYRALTAQEKTDG